MDWPSRLGHLGCAETLALRQSSLEVFSHTTRCRFCERLVAPAMFTSTSSLALDSTAAIVPSKHEAATSERARGNRWSTAPIAEPPTRNEQAIAFWFYLAARLSRAMSESIAR